MKKFLGLLLGVILMVGLFAVPASAVGSHTNWAFRFTAYTNGSAFTNANNYKEKDGNEDFIEVRHEVKNSTAGYTNRMCGVIIGTDVYAGGKWQLPNMIYWTCTSSTFNAGKWITPGGRGNTDYATYQGLATVQLEGQFRTH